MKFKYEKKYTLASLCIIILTGMLLGSASCINIFMHNDSGLWFYNYSSGEPALNVNLTPASFLFLNPDKTYTLDFGKFNYGKWIETGDTLVLHSVNGEVNKYCINYETDMTLNCLSMKT